MALDPVVLNDPHVPAHNEEREAINTLQEEMLKKVDKPNAPALGSLLRWDGDNWMPTKMRLFEGVGSPETVVSAPPGSRYVDTTAASGSAEYFKASGTGNTGWQALNTGIDWTTIAPATGYTHSSGRTAQASLVNNVVYLRGSLRKTSGTTTIIGRVPTAMIPPVSIYGAVRIGSTPAVIIAISAANGDLLLSATPALNTDIYLESVTCAPYRK